MRPILMKGQERPLTFLKYNREGYSPAPRITHRPSGSQTTASVSAPIADTMAPSVDFSVGDKLVVITTDPFMEVLSAIHVKWIARDPSDQSGKSVLIRRGHQGRIDRAVWGPLNKTIISAGEDAIIRVWDSETGKLLKQSDKESGHKKAIISLTMAADGSLALKINQPSSGTQEC